MAGAWEAVIGSEVATTNNWKVGDEFRMIHGGQDDHVHDERFTITGVLDRTNTPNDRSVFVNLEGFLSLGGHEKPLDGSDSVGVGVLRRRHRGAASRSTRRKSRPRPMRRPGACTITPAEWCRTFSGRSRRSSWSAKGATTCRTRGERDEPADVSAGRVSGPMRRIP